MYELELTAHDRQQHDFHYDSAIYKDVAKRAHTSLLPYFRLRERVTEIKYYRARV